MGMDSSFCFGTLTSLVLIIVYVTSHSKAILLRVICLHPITFSLSSLFYYSYLNTIYLHRNCMVKRFIYYFETVSLFCFIKITFNENM